MEFEQFLKIAQDTLPVSKVLQNPVKGTSIIKAFNNETIYYKRLNSTLYINIHNMFDAYKKFAGKTCTTTDLKKWRQNVFSQSAHSCNCTFLFSALYEMGLSTKQRKSDAFYRPYCVDIYPENIRKNKP